MINEVIYYIKQDKKIYEYLKYHSYWYKILIDNPDRIKDLIKEMRIELHDTVEDKLNNLNDKIKLLQTMFNLII